MDPLAKAKEQQRKAAAHGRRTKLERGLNVIGLSLFAPPLGSAAERKPFTQRTFPGKPLSDIEMRQANQLAMDEPRIVQGNEWEGWTGSKWQPEIFRLISRVGTAINNIDRAARDRDPEDQLLLQERCTEAMAELTKLARYVSTKKYE